MPTSSAQFGNVLSGIGGLVEGIGGIFDARSQKSAGEYNATIYEQQAKATRESQALLEVQKRKIIKSQIGSQISGYAASGVKYSGSPVQVALDSLTNANLDIAIDKYNSEVKARGFQSEAEMSRYEGRQKASSSYVRAGKSLLTTAADQYLSQSEIGGKKLKI